MEPLHAWAVAAVVLYVKMLVVASLQGVWRLRANAFEKPEDAAFFGSGEVRDELPEVARAQRTLVNDLENIPMFLFLAAAYVALGAWPGAAAGYFGVFVGSRVVHTFAYLRPRQPLRNRAYVVGQLVCVVLAGHVIAVIVGVDPSLFAWLSGRGP
ncbi:MAG: MAPEG family protein [Myxococcota bacterium]